MKKSTFSKHPRMASGKDARGDAQREDAIESRDKALAKRSQFRGVSNAQEKMASMKRDHPKPKYKEE